MTQVILLAGYKGSGKTTVAQMIGEMLEFEFNLSIDYRLMSFAEPVKRIATEQFGWDGNKDEKGRLILQRIGTEVGRAYNKDIWVEKALEEIQRDEICYDFIIFDDTRFPNEYTGLEYGAFESVSTIRIVDKTYNNEDAHTSETAMDEFLFDYQLEHGREGVDKMKPVLKAILEGIMSLKDEEDEFLG